MPRPPRLNLVGLHHIVNYGVAKEVVYRCDDDKKMFLDILCKACKTYKVRVHDYCLLEDYYHLVVETKDENLPIFMRQISSNYAIYFNKKYDRYGHLWQGRYKSWFIIDEKYLYDLFRYIEHKPIEEKMAQKVGEYPFTLLATLMHTEYKLILCARSSKLKKEIGNREFQALLEMPLSPKELQSLRIEQKKKISKKNFVVTQEKKSTLKEHFINSNDKESRDYAILQAIEDGYRQADIARYLQLTPSMISKIVAMYTKDN